MSGVDVLTARLARLANRRWLAGTFAACLAPIAAIYAVAARYDVTANGPDRAFAYTSAEAYAMLARLGPAGRYGLTLIHAFDYVYVVAYALFFGIAIAGIATRLAPSSVGLRRLAVLPVLTGLADAFENVCLDIAVRAFPRHLDLLLALAGGLTTFKAVAMRLCQLLVVAGLAALLVRRLRRTSSSPLPAAP